MVEKSSRYQVEFSTKAINDIQHIDRLIAQRILNKIKWLANNFEDTVPEKLSGTWRDKFKLRVGDWRIIYTVAQAKKLITVHLVGHRREIYR